MVLWSTMGNLLRGSGWPEVLTEAGMTKSEAAAVLFLSASNVMRTRYAHKVTLVVLDILLKRAHEFQSEVLFENWITNAKQVSPTVTFWFLIHKYQQLVLMFIRAHRERKIQLMLDSLRMLVPIFFALDHQNYARWIPIFIQDLERLPTDIQKEFVEGRWTIKKSSRLFSNIPMDQAHEQPNKSQRRWWHDWSH